MVYMLSEWSTRHAVILFLSMSTGILSLPYHWSVLGSDVSYDDLVKLNLTCGDLHSCQMRNSSSIDDLRYYNCHCGPTCMQMGTCCVDSKYRTPLPGYDRSGVTCAPSEGYILLEIYVCRSDWDGDDFVRDLCHGNARVLNDPLLLVPVSSSRTGITYRNYFCFVCNEDVEADGPVFWNIELTSESENVSRIPLTDLIYKRDFFSWAVRGTQTTVSINFKIPGELQSLLKLCRNTYTIKTCDENWNDAITKDKCQAYMAEFVISGDYFGTHYHNPHCAICNFEDLSKGLCTFKAKGPISVPPLMADGIPGVLFLGLFSWENKTIKCPKNKIFDSFKNKCRAFRCGKGMVNVDGKCEVKRI